MLTTEHLQIIWATALREHAVRPLDGENGPYLAISGPQADDGDASVVP